LRETSIIAPWPADPQQVLPARFDVYVRHAPTPGSMTYSWRVNNGAALKDDERHSSQIELIAVVSPPTLT